jgi:hypothetical protein
MTARSIDKLNDMTRRDFGKVTAMAGVGTLLARSSLAALESGRKTRYAIVGLGVRSQMYQKAVLEQYAGHSEMVGYCDVNLGRLQLAHPSMTPRISREWCARASRTW